MQESLNSQIADLVMAANKILLLTHSDPDVDITCALTSFYTFLKEHYKKQVDICIADALKPRNSGIFAKANIQKDSILDALPQKTYIISIKREGEKIESVNFNNDESAFNFVITPFNGKLDLQNISINEAGASYDLIVFFDIESFDELGELYVKNTTLFDPKRIVNFTSKRNENKISNFIVSDDSLQTTSQLVLSFLRSLQVQLPNLVSSLLFAGIYSSLKVAINERVRANTFTDLAFAAQNSINMQEINDILYSPASLNEIFLIGDILDSSNEGEIELLDNGKMIGCKISLNKEELEQVDTNKVSQIIFWNIKIPTLAFGYVIFQRSHTESMVYIQAYQHKDEVTKALQDKKLFNAQDSVQYVFAGDMNQAEADLKKIFKLQFKDAKSSSFAGINAFDDNDLAPVSDVSSEQLFGLPPVDPSPPLPLFDSSPFSQSSFSPGQIDEIPQAQPVRDEKNKNNTERPLFDPRKAE